MGIARPRTLQTALDALNAPFQTIIAGGTDIFPAARQGQMPQSLLDVTAIKELRDISRIDGVTRIGAAATWSDIRAAQLPPAFDALKQAAREVGSIQIQNTGTIGGNICNASPAADGVPALLALEARVEIASASRPNRIVALSDFILGVRKTALSEGELVCALLVPDVPEGTRSAFEKLGGRRYLVISICMVAANICLDNDGQITYARIAVGSCSAVAQRLVQLETDLIGQTPADVMILPHHLSPLTPIDDVRGSADYRLDAVSEQCRRAISRAAQA